MEIDKSDLIGYYDHKGRRFAERCTNCGDCLRACPVFPLTKYADRGPEVVMEKVTELLGGGETSDEAYEMAFSCSQGCVAVCHSACSVGLWPMLGFQSAVVKIKEAGKKLPYLTYQTLPGNRYNVRNVFSSLQMKPSEARWLTQVPADPRPVDLVFFSGCGASALPHVLQGIIDVIGSMGIDYVAMSGGDLCCGSGILLWGDVEGARQASQRLVSAIASFSPKKVVFFCGGCLNILSGSTSRAIDIPFERVGLLQFLEENMARIPFKNRIDKAVAIHDACILSSVPGSYDRLRKLLGAIPGLTLVEMEHNRESALCCGGVTEFTRPEIAEQFRRPPLEEAKAAGAEAVATVCSACHRVFSPLEGDYHLEVKHYTSFLAESIGTPHEDTYKKYSKYQSLAEVLAEARECIEANGYTIEEMERALADYSAFLPGHGTSSP
ncbi:(Fe-S)-binding protein [Chloroflexota bacterium]